MADIKQQKQAIKKLITLFELATDEHLKQYADYLTTGQIINFEQGINDGKYADCIGLPLKNSQFEPLSVAVMQTKDKQQHNQMTGKLLMRYEPNNYAQGAYILGSLTETNTVYAVTDLLEGYAIHRSMPDAVVLIAFTDKNLVHVVKEWGSKVGNRLQVPIACNLLSQYQQMLPKDCHILSLAYEIAIDADNSDDVKHLLDSANTTSETKKTNLLEKPFFYDGMTYEIRNSGIYLVGEDSTHRLCSYLEILAETRDTSSNAWGRLLKWSDRDNNTHIYALPMTMLQGDGLEFRQILADGGMYITPDAKHRKNLQKFIQVYQVDSRAYCVDKLGWHQNHAFVMADKSIGNNSDDLVVYQSNTGVRPQIEQQGTLAQWQTHVAQPAIGQSRLVFSLCTAFAGVLLEPCNMLGGGFHLFGTSSIGKSTVLNVASSVWGSPEKYKRSWRATDNALEGVCLAHNSMTLVLDEMGECDPKSLGKTIYMIANGVPKSRMSKNVVNREVKTWCLLFLSTGEVSAKQLLEDTGQTVKAGQEIRLVQIEAQSKYGVFDSISFGVDGADQSNLLRDGYSQYFGSAGIAWLEYITKDKKAITTTANTMIKGFMDGLPKNINNTGIRVAERFALVATAGELATQAGITTWQQGEATKACKTLLSQWLVKFGTGNIEHNNILVQIKSFIEQHGSSRFDNLNTQFENKVINRAGYVETDQNGDKLYYLLDIGLKTMCGSYNIKEAIKALDSAGWLLKNDQLRPKYRLRTAKEKLCGAKRMFVIDASRMYEYFEKPNVDKNAWELWELGNKAETARLSAVPNTKNVLGTVGTHCLNNKQIPKIPNSQNTMGTGQSHTTHGLFPNSQNSQQKNATFETKQVNAPNDCDYQNAQHVSQVTFTTHTDENGRTYQVPSSRGIIV